MDIDRAYVINGDNLRIELGGSNGRPPLVPNPHDVAEYLIDRIARPALTRAQLAKALDHQWVHAENRDGMHHAQIANADSVAREVWEKLVDQPKAAADVAGAHVCCEHAGTVPGPFPDPELSAMAVVGALDEDARARVLYYLARRYDLDV